MSLSKMELDDLRHFLVAQRQRRHEVTVEIHGEHASGLEKEAHPAISGDVVDLNVHVSANVQGLFPRRHTYANSAYMHPPIESDKQQVDKYNHHGLCQVSCKPLSVVKAAVPVFRAWLLLGHVMSYPK